MELSLFPPSPASQVLGRLIRAVAITDAKAALQMEKELPVVGAAQV